ncbi:MAG TPA: hypothetical protein PLK77_16145 [Pyrinomonadaceae bacterium]|nr:hypothetical protein [Pyrinomonadaceae bacterium]
MNNTELLKSSRDLLLKLHKSLLDHERRIYEGINGTRTPGQFLNLLLEDPDFAWLRKFSTLIVEIDEMFAQKDGYSQDAVESHIVALRSLVAMKDEDETFKTKYQSGLQQDLDAASRHGELRALLFDE